MITVPATCRYLALGDSYTCGEGVASDERWPEQLALALRRESIAVSEVQVVARTGWTTQELAAGMDMVSLQPAYDLVSLQIGVNNQYAEQSPNTYRTSFRTLLARSVMLAGDRASRVLVVSIPDWGNTPHAREQARDSVRVAMELDRYNAIAHEEVARSGAQWVDITVVSRQRQPDWIGVDGLHPTAAQYTAWVKVIVRAAHTVLG